MSVFAVIETSVETRFWAVFSCSDENAARIAPVIVIILKLEQLDEGIPFKRQQQRRGVPTRLKCPRDSIRDSRDVSL